MSTPHKTLCIPNELSGCRLDQAITELLQDYSRAQIQTWIKQGQITDEKGQALRSKDKAQVDQLIILEIASLPSTNWKAEAIPLDILYEDEDLIVLNKPAGLVVHPGAGTPSATLINGLLYYRPELATLPRSGLIHRLDKDTSGLLVVTKTTLAHQVLTEALQARQIHRGYEAIVKGVLISGGTIDTPIGRHPKYRTKKAVVPEGRPALTHYRVIQRYRQHTHVAITLETGRTHQIRVHFDHQHHPLLGDPCYGTHRRPPGPYTMRLQTLLRTFKRQALHAKSLQLVHPRHQTPLSWECPLPNDMLSLLEALKEDLFQNESSPC